MCKMPKNANDFFAAQRPMVFDFYLTETPMGFLFGAQTPIFFSGEEAPMDFYFGSWV